MVKISETIFALIPFLVIRFKDLNLVGLQVQITSNKNDLIN